jgi:hypothetical protein
MVWGMTAPKGAPLPGGKPVRRVEAKSAPTSFPKPAFVPAPQRENKLYNVRMCQKCGREGRVVSNTNGIHIFCQCGFNWPISSSALNPPAPMVPARGLQKTTMVEPDWSRAEEDLGVRSNESIGPKPRG